MDGQVAINPLAMRKAISRPKKMRNKVNDEIRNPYMLPIKLTIIICHKCEAIRHNKRSCKGKRAADRAIPKGGNKKNGITCAKYDGKKKKRIHVHQRMEIRRKKDMCNRDQRLITDTTTYTTISSLVSLGVILLFFLLCLCHFAVMDKSI